NPLPTRRSSDLQAAEERMEPLINTTRNDWTDTFNAEVAEIYRKADEDYNRIETEITGVINSTREEMEIEFNESVQNTREYAEQQARERADTVQSNLESATSEHQGMIDELFDNVVDFNQFKTDINVDVSGLQSKVIDFDDFLGDISSITLDERFQDITMNFEERIRNIDSTHYNMIRGTSFDNPDLYSKHNSVEIITNEVDNFARLGLGTTSLPYVRTTEYFNVKSGQTYHLIFMYRTSDVPEIDFIRLRPPLDPYGADLMIEDGMTPEEKSTTMSGEWTKKEVTFVSDRDMPVSLLLGTNFGAGNTQRGILDIKKPYLT